MNNTNKPVDYSPIATHRLVQNISEVTDIDNLISMLDRELDEFQIIKYPTVAEYLVKYMGEDDLKKKRINLVRKAEEFRFQKQNCRAVINGTRGGSRDMLLAFAIILGMTYKQTQSLLRCGEFMELYPKNMRDAIIIYGIKNRHSLNLINLNLAEVRYCKQIAYGDLPDIVGSPEPEVDDDWYI